MNLETPCLPACDSTSCASMQESKHHYGTHVYGLSYDVYKSFVTVTYYAFHVVQARRAAEREEARRRQVAAKEGFMQLLEETLELEVGDSFDRASKLLNHDGRWKVGCCKAWSRDCTLLADCQPLCVHVCYFGANFGATHGEGLTSWI